MSGFLDFNSKLLNTTDVRARVLGSLRIFVAGKWRPVNFDRIITLKGLEGLSIEVASVKLLNGQYSALQTSSVVLNPSEIEFDMVSSEHLLQVQCVHMAKGDVTFTTSFRNITIAQLSGRLDLRHGSKNMTQAGQLLTDNLVTDPVAVAAFAQESRENAVHVSLRGTKAESGIAWVTAIIREINRDIMLPLGNLS